MQNVTLTGINRGKHSFHVHCQDRSGNTLLHKKFSRTKLMALVNVETKTCWFSASGCLSRESSISQEAWLNG